MCVFVRVVLKESSFVWQQLHCICEDNSNSKSMRRLVAQVTTNLPLVDHYVECSFWMNIRNFGDGSNSTSDTIVSRWEFSQLVFLIYLYHVINIDKHKTVVKQLPRGLNIKVAKLKILCVLICLQHGRVLTTILGTPEILHLPFSGYRTDRMELEEY